MFRKNIPVGYPFSGVSQKFKIRNTLNVTNITYLLEAKTVKEKQTPA